MLRSPKTCVLFPIHTHICAEVPLGPEDWFRVPLVPTSGLPVRTFLLHLAELVADFVVLHIALDGSVLLDPHHLGIIHHCQLLALHLLKICMVFDLFIEKSHNLQSNSLLSHNFDLFCILKVFILSMITSSLNRYLGFDLTITKVNPVSTKSTQSHYSQWYEVNTSYQMQADVSTQTFNSMV